MNTPIKSIDRTDSVEDRLTSNVTQNVLPARYLRQDSGGNVEETPEQMFERVAENVAQPCDDFEEGWSAEYAQEQFENAMKELRLMPNSPCLMNAGTDMNQLSACFVLEPEDDMEDIYDTAKSAALVFQSGGGVGYPFHHLRPKGTHISSTGGESSGPIDFMRTFDTTCDNVKQGGKRRGAQMGILRADHPDIGRFITAKRVEGALSNFNISVGVTDDFVDAVEAGKDYTLMDPTEDFEEPFETVEATKNFYDPQYRNNPEDAFGVGEGKPVESNLWRDHADSIEVVAEQSFTDKWADEIDIERGEPLTLPARFLWDIMVDGAWRNGEPGIFNYDESNKDHTFDVDKHPEEVIEATNPCAEQPLSEFEACNLGHVNLSLMVEEDAPTWEDFHGDITSYVDTALDVIEFKETIATGTVFLENVVTQSDFPIPEIEETVAEYRKIGVGIMGLAQMLYQMGVAYDSQAGRDIAAEVQRRVQKQSTLTSNELAQFRGTFDKYEQSKWANPAENPDWFRKHTGGLDPQDHEDGLPVRNHKQTTIAPCGTTSMIGDTSGGCEPVFSVAYYKNVGGDIQGDDMLVEFDSLFLEALEESGADVETVKREAQSQMEADEWDGVDGLATVPDSFGEVFVTTQQIAPADHVFMQRRLQKYVDSGISKTINLPEHATRDDVAHAYTLSLTDGLGGRAKGLTVYRDGSRDEQVKTTSGDMNSDENTETNPVKMYQSDQISDEEVERLVMMKEQDASACPECEEGVLRMQEGCDLCPECGYSGCA